MSNVNSQSCKKQRTDISLYRLNKMNLVNFVSIRLLRLLRLLVKIINAGVNLFSILIFVLDLFFFVCIFLI